MTDRKPNHGAGSRTIPKLPDMKARLLYIDNIRIVLISLIVLLHLAITYGAPGDWYFHEVQL